MRFFLVGIKGSGMSSLAHLLLDQKHQVNGADTDSFIETEVDLLKRSVKIVPIFTPLEDDVDIIIFGHAFKSEKYLNYYQKYNLPIVEYNHFLAFFINSNKLISIAGSHGKTTLVKLLATALKDNVSYLCGDGSGKMIDKDSLFILESCEYQDHFLVYKPEVSIISNISYDHIDYFTSEEQYQESFQRFADNSKRLLISFSNSSKIKHLNMMTYGILKGDYYLKDVIVNKNSIGGKLFYHQEYLIEFSLPFVGEHFLEMVVGVLAFCHIYNYSLETAIINLSHFVQAKKRFNEIILKDRVIIVDYAHHPEQMKVNYDVIRKKYQEYQSVAIFKPDRPSRLEYFKDEFKKELSKYDLAFVLEIPGPNKMSAAYLSNKKIKFLSSIQEINKYLTKRKYVFSVMSSKEMKNIVDYLKNIVIKPV